MNDGDWNWRNRCHKSAAEQLGQVYSDDEPLFNSTVGGLATGTTALLSMVAVAKYVFLQRL